MATFQTNNTDHLIRSSLWSSSLKEVLEADLMGMKYVDIISDFPDGDTLNIPSLGQAEVYNYAEGQAIRYNAFDTGNFQFSITDYKASAMAISNKMKQDSFYMDRLVASFVPKQSRALMVAMESSIMAIGPDGQTSANSNTINGAKHRFVGGGAGDTMAIEDFAKARYALQKANVPMTNLVAIVDPSVEYKLSTLTNHVNMSNNPRWEGIVSSGISSGMRFITNIYGFDVYTSQYLKSGISETIDGNAVSSGVANLFFSAAQGVLPFVGAVRQSPKVDSDYNKDLQQDEYVTTARWGFKLFRPENLAVILTATDQVYA